MSYTLPVPATDAQMRDLAATIAREAPNRSRRITLRFGTCTMLPPTKAEEVQYPGTVSAAYALEMLSESLSASSPKPNKAEQAKKRLATLTCSVQAQMCTFQSFANTLNADPGNFIHPDSLLHTLEQVEANLARLRECVAELPSMYSYIGCPSL